MEHGMKRCEQLKKEGLMAIIIDIFRNSVLVNNVT